jgi:hypothetical protein
MNATVRRLYAGIEADRRRMAGLTQDAQAEHQDAARRLARYYRTDKIQTAIVLAIVLAGFVLLGVLIAIPSL